MLRDLTSTHEGHFRQPGNKPLGKLNNKELGNLGEDCAAAFLESHGYEILDRNWRCNCGEADIICRYEGAIVLVEVKTRYKTSLKCDPIPELAVDARKQRRYQLIALSYFAYHLPCDHVRFDVIAINIYDPDIYRLRHLESAFECDA